MRSLLSAPQTPLVYADGTANLPWPVLTEAACTEMLRPGWLWSQQGSVVQQELAAQQGSVAPRMAVQSERKVRSLDTRVGHFVQHLLELLRRHRIIREVLGVLNLQHGRWAVECSQWERPCTYTKGDVHQ